MFILDKFVIEKDIPLDCVITKKAGRPAKYPFADMEVGDSILAEGDTCNTEKCKAYNAAKEYGRLHGIKFSGRAQGDGTVRIWRVA